MKILTLKGDVLEHKIPAGIRGLRITQVALDSMDVSNILNMHEADIVSFFMTLKASMRVPLGTSKE